MKTLFHRWIAFFVVMNIGLYYAWINGLFHAIYAADITFISFVILIATYVFTLLNGWRLYKRRNVAYKADTSVDWYATSLCTRFGLVGTAIGFIFMLSSFGDINFDDLSTVTEVIVEATGYMATAFYTTLAGIIGSIVIGLQAFVLEREMKNVGK